MWSDNETDKDLLGFDVHANLIKRVITDESILPVTLGVFGDWGSGKSSIMKMLERELNTEDQKSTACLYFNGWVFEGYDDAKAALIEEILEKLKENEKFGHKIKDEVNNLLKSVNWLRLAGYLTDNVAKPAIKALATGGFSLIFDSASNDSNSADEFEKIIKKEDRNDIHCVVRKFRVDFEKIIEKTELKSLVILIDDLDRCSPDRIIDNLEAIKLFLNVPKTAFLIGADERIVRHAIECRYKEAINYSEEIKQYKGIVTDYLEKLIQVPYRLPRLSNADVETYMTLLFCYRDLSEEDFDIIYNQYKEFRTEDRHSCFDYSKISGSLNNMQCKNDVDISEQLIMLKQIAPLITDGLKGNPRQIKRFLNTFTLRLELAKIAKFEIEEKILAKLMVLEYSELEKFKELCDWQQLQNGTPQEIIDLEDYAEDPINNTTLKKAGWDEAFILKWLKMNPSLKDVNLMDYYWIARDRLEKTIDADSMLPQKYRQIYKSLNEYTTNSSLEKEAKKIKDLNENDRIIISNMIGKDMLDNPDINKSFEIAHALIEVEWHEMLTEYIRVFKELIDSKKDSLISPSVAIGLKRISENQSKLKALLPDLDQKSKFSKALNVNLKKR